MKTVLSLCDYSGVWSQPYVDAGYNVIRVDLQKDGQDVRLFEHMDNIYGILAAPPCTVFACSGNRWRGNRTQEDIINALSVVDACIRIVWSHRQTVKWWALENPRGTLVRYLGKPKMYFNPCDFGDPWTKKTCLWGNFVPPLPIILGEYRNVAPVEGSKMHLKYGGARLATKNARSQTPEGFARAFFEVNP